MTILSHQEKMQYASIINSIKYLVINKVCFKHHIGTRHYRTARWMIPFFKTTRMQLFFNISVFFLFCCSFWSERIPPRVSRDLGEAFCQVLLIFSFACIFVCKNLCSLNTQTSASGIFHKASEVRRTALSDGKSCTGYGVSPLPHLPLGIALTGWNVLTLMCLSNEGEIEIKDLGSGGATF